MKTEHLYYTELKEDLMQAGGLKPAASAADSRGAACARARVIFLSPLYKSARVC